MTEFPLIISDGSDQLPESTQIDDIDTLLSATRNSVDNIEDSLAQIRHARNFTTRVNLLPLEILIRVLDLSLDTDKVLANAGRLSSVCRYWNQIFESTPTFWTAIDCNERPYHVQRALRNSTPLLLDFRFTSRPHSWGPSRSYGLRDFWNGVFSHLDRCRSLSLNVTSYNELAAPERRAAPALERLSLAVSDIPWGDTLEPLDLFGGQAPKLQDLNLYGYMNVNWSAEMFSGLRKLNLAAMGQQAPNVSSLLYILARNPGLKFLKMELYSQIAEDFFAASDTISLLSLQELRIDGLPEARLRYLLSHIRIPSCHDFDVSIVNHLNPVSLDALRETFDFVRMILEPVRLTSHGTIAFAFLPYYSTLGCAVKRLDETYSLTFTLPSSIVDGFLPLILSTITPLLESYATEVDFRPHSDTTNVQSLSWLSQIPRLSKLAVFQDGLSDAAVGYLATPCDGAGLVEWKHPDLADLCFTLESGYDLGSILKMLRYRYGLGRAGEESVGEVNTTRLPRPLTRFTIFAQPGFDEEIYEEMEHIVGQTNIQIVIPPQNLGAHLE